MSWDKKFMGLANYIATWSKDPSTKVGAVIVNSDKRVVSLGYNGFPQGVDDSVVGRYERPLKYRWTVHAEENAIVSSGRVGASVKGATMYCNYKPCEHCSKLIIQAGIRRVVYQHEKVNSQKGVEEKTITETLFKEANVEIIRLSL